MSRILLGRHRSEGGDHISRVKSCKRVAKVGETWRRRWTTVATPVDACGGEGDTWVGRGRVVWLESTWG